MTIRIVFLGPLADIAPAPDMRADAPLDWAGLLALAGEESARHMRSDKVHVACAGTVLADKTALNAQTGDEVAVLPPVSGG
ncbi:MoaD/ThiS family protein [Pontixanthobacter sp.]|uniref:MoaD/ThiS family protein n=1 Tax=Pontixanthobacter sp. TaxID=2792078 RepID=UPI003C7C2F09